MALQCLCGVPGSGKTLNSTRIAIKHYKIENNLIKKGIIYFLSYFKIPKFITLKENYNRFKNKKINNVYSNYPILLDKKNNIYSIPIDIWDLDNNYSFEPNAIIILDEIQLRVDSDEYKNKEVNKRIGKIAKFLQAHRHFGIKNIYFISQHPSRIFKKARNVCEIYYKQSKLFKIPFTPYSYMKMIGYFTLEDYGKYIPKDRQERKKLPFEYTKKILFFNHKKVFNSYDSRYLANYNYNRPLYEYSNYTNLRINDDKLEEIFNYT